MASKSEEKKVKTTAKKTDAKTEKKEATKKVDTKKKAATATKTTNKKSAPKKVEEKVKKEVVANTEEKTVKKETTKKTDNKRGKKDQPKKEGFIKSIIKEMKLVRFPNKKEMIKYSIATIVFVIFFGLLFYAVELIVAWLKMVI